MKKLVSLTFALFASFALMAQTTPYISFEGYVEGESGAQYLIPQSTIAVDLVVEREVVTAGPYARYALKNLGIRAPFSDKVTFRLLSADISLHNPDDYSKSDVESQVEVSKSHLDAIPADRLNILQPSDEDAALDAATQIFALRRSRLDLITGEAGEHVFGEGLGIALKEIDEREQALMELFLGRVELSRETYRVILQPSSDKNQYILCRFSEEAGIVDASDLSADIVLLDITAGNTPTVTEASEKARAFVKCRLAALSECQVLLGDELLGSRQLPLFEYGRSVTLEK